MSSFTPEERAAIQAQARAHIADAKDLKPREVDVLADLSDVVGLPRTAQFAQLDLEPEQVTSEFRKSDFEPELLVTRSLDSSRAEIIAAVVAEVTTTLDEHRSFIADQLASVVAAIVDSSVEHVDKQVDAAYAALLAQIETLRAECAQMRAELARLSATEIDGRAVGCGPLVLKH